MLSELPFIWRTFFLTDLCSSTFFYRYVDATPPNDTDPLGLVKWHGSVVSAGVTTHHNLARYTLVSECVGGWQTEVVVDVVSGGGTGWGAVTSSASFEDAFPYVNPQVFNGVFADVSAGGAAYFGFSFGATIMGGAQSPAGPPSAVKGVGAWAGASAGVSRVVRERSWRCTCPVR